MFSPKTLDMKFHCSIWDSKFDSFKLENGTHWVFWSIDIVTTLLSNEYRLSRDLLEYTNP